MSATTSRRALLAGATALTAGSAANVAAIVSTHASEPDPIFAAIERHRTACYEFNAAVHAESDAEFLAGATERRSAASDEMADALLVLLTVPPPTLDGVIALCQHLAEPEFMDEEDSDKSLLEGAFEYGDELGAAANKFAAMLADALSAIAVEGAAS